MPVAIRSSRDLWRVHLDKSILDEAGIESYVHEERFWTLYSFFQSVGAHQLYVSEEDAERARELIGAEDPGPGIDYVKRTRIARRFAIGLAVFIVIGTIIGIIEAIRLS